MNYKSIINSCRQQRLGIKSLIAWDKSVSVNMSKSARHDRLPLIRSSFKKLLPQTSFPRSWRLATAGMALATAGSCLAQSASQSAAVTDATKPNVIFIMADDQGSVDAGCYGATDVKTPALDSLAAKGVRFTQFYSAAPVCSPSRAGLLTGRYPWLVGMPNNAPTPPSEKYDDMDTYTGRGLTTNGINMPKLFKSAGYVTAQIGKWHLGWGEGHKPLDQGFDYSFGFMGGCIDNYSHFNYWGGPNRHDLWENDRRVRYPGIFFPDLMIEKTETFIRTHRHKPFFIYFAANVPHYPYQGDPKWLAYYKSKHVPYPRDLYAAWLSTLDDRLRELFEFLDANGLRNNTIIAYQSDNGYSTEARAHYGGGSSGPYRGAKFSLFEGGIRLPAVISWPGHLPEGQVRGQIAYACDWLPTLADLCGIKCSTKGLDGRSLVPVIRSAEAPSPNDTLRWMLGKQWAVRQGPWKLLHDPRDTVSHKPVKLVDGQWFLANIDKDPGERTNVAASHPDIVERLKKLAP